MTKEELRIVFMGTPEFAVASLQALVEGNYNVVGVITMPDKPAGRGYKMQQSAIKEYALSVGLPTLQPERLKDESFLNDLKELRADLQIVVAFRMLPEAVWNMPRYGTFNLHASLLPDYRGAAPINWAVMNGDSHTGVSTFFLTHEIDTGAVILQKQINIEEQDNAGTVYTRLMLIGADVLTQTVDLIIQERVTPIEQTLMSTSSQRPAPKIFKDTCQLCFSRPARELHNQVRGLSPYPAAWMEVSSALHPEFNTTIKVYTTTVLHLNSPINAGTIIAENKRIMIGTSDGVLELIELQMAGKRRMSASELLNGICIPSDAKTTLATSIANCTKKTGNSI